MRLSRRSAGAEKGGWLRMRTGAADDPIVKPASYLPRYEQQLAPYRDRPFALLELGVWTGESLAMWRDTFPLATIVGVDLKPPALELGDRVHIIEGDQTDPALMRRLREQYAPDGFDVIIDDASHLGVFTARSLQVLYNDHLRPGGLYAVEDWGTGYSEGWLDGGALQEPVGTACLDSSDRPFEPPYPPGAIRMPSHDVGMVGLVKRLIDHVSAAAEVMAKAEGNGGYLAIESMTVFNSIVFLRKPLD